MPLAVRLSDRLGRIWARPTQREDRLIGVEAHESALDCEAELAQKASGTSVCRLGLGDYMAEPKFPGLVERCCHCGAGDAAALRIRREHE